MNLSNIPSFPNARPLTLQDKPFLTALYRRYPPQVCELCLANLFIWGDADKPQITQLNGNILIRLDSIIEPSFYLEPIGDIDIVKTTKTVLETGAHFSRVSHSFAQFFFNTSITIQSLADQFDYIFATENFREFKGRKYDGKRNHIHKFTQLYPDYQYRELDSTYSSDALTLFDNWSAPKLASNELTAESYAIQRLAIEKAFQLFHELDFLGGAIYIQNQMAGFVLASPLNSETADLHFFHGDSAFTGIFPTLIQAAAIHTFTSFQFLNFEQDLGLPGLRKSKESYHPIALIQKFSCR